MNALPELQGVTNLSRFVTRILGQNPSKFTLQGTNSYLVHHPESPSLLLIDTTGPSSSSPLPPSAEQAYLSNLRSAVLAHPVQPAHVGDIVLTHWHRDHVGGLRSVVEMLSEMHGGHGVRVWKMPCAGGEAWKSEAGKDEEIEAALQGPPKGVLLPRQGAKKVRPLQPGQHFRLEPPSSASSGSKEAVELEVVHTPGHTSDSICLALRLLPSRHLAQPSASSATSRPASPQLLALFTADTVLGHGTAVFTSLSRYLVSLSSLVDLLQRADRAVPLYPGHGEVVTGGLGKVSEYKAHRAERERQVITALQEVETGSGVEASKLVDQIYGSTIPDSLKPAATHGVLLHLAKLEEEGSVEHVPRSLFTDGVPLEGQGGGEVGLPMGWSDGWRWTGKAA